MFLSQNVGNSGKCPLIYDRGSLYPPPQPSYVFVPPSRIQSDVVWERRLLIPQTREGTSAQTSALAAKKGVFKKVPRTHDFPTKCPRPFFSVASPSTLIEMRISKKRKIDRFFRRRRQTALIFFLSSHGLLNVSFSRSSFDYYLFSLS